MSAFIVTFMLVSLGKLHNEYEREQAASLKIYPEGRRVLSLQHPSKDKMPVRVKRQQLTADLKFNPAQISDEENQMHANDDVNVEVKGDNHINPEETELGYADTIAIEDNINDLSNFEELDGFNYVANKEKHDADLKLSNNIRVAGDNVVVEENDRINHVVQKDNVDPNVIDPNDPNTWQHKSHQTRTDFDDRNKLHEKHLSEKTADLHQDDAEDMPLHEQQLLERNIVQHKPIKPNLPPEDEHYDAHEYFYQKDNRPVKAGAGKQSFGNGNQVQFHDPNIGNLKMKEIRLKKHVNYESSNTELVNIGQDSYKKNPQGYQNVDGENNVQHSNMYNSQKLKQSNTGIVRVQNHDIQQVQQFSQKAERTFDPNQMQDNVQFVDKLIQQQSQYRQENQDDHTQKSRKRRKKRKKGSKRNDKLTNNTVIFESQRQDQFNNVKSMRSAFLATQNSPVLNIYMKPNGRLGNQLFEIASLYGISRRTGRKPYMSKYNDIYQIFTHANRTVATGEASDDLGILFEEKPGMFSSDLFSLPPTDLVLCCYFQSWKYFDGYQSDIRKMFHFRGKIRKLARTIISKAKHVFLTHLTDQVTQFGNTQTLTYIGVHVRRGDLQLEHHLHRGYKPAPLTYFHKAMDYYRQHFPNTIFLVTSDDIEWCKVKLGSSDVFFVEGQHEAVDMAVLSMTNHTVISVGTFSWWAGWLAGGQVIYYRNWPTRNSEVAQQYEHDDYFLPKWKSMSD